MIDEEKLSEKMFEATKEIYSAVKGIPTIAVVGLLDAIKTDFLLNYHVRQDGMIAPLRTKRNKQTDVYNSGDKALGGTKTVSNDTIDEKNNSLTAHPKPR